MPTFIPIERDPNAEVKQAFVYNEDFNINTPEFDNLSAEQKQIIENFINENTTNGNFLASGTIISFNFDAAEPVWDASNGLKLNEDGQIVRRPTNSEWFVSVDDDGSIRLVEKEENGNVQYDGENFGWTIGENDNSLDGYLIGGEKVSKLIKEAEDNDETLGDYLKKQTNLSEEELADKTEDLNLNMKLIEEKYEEEQAQRDIAKAAAERADETPVYDETFDETSTESDEVPQPEPVPQPAPEQKPELEQKPEPEPKPEEKPEEDNERIMEATTATVGFFAQLRKAYQNGENIGDSLGNVLATIREISASRKAEKEKAKQDAIAAKEDAKLQKAKAKEDKKEAAKEVKKPGFDKLSAVDKVRVNYYTQFISAALKSKHIEIDDDAIRSAIVLGVTSLVRDKENRLDHVIKNPDNSKKIIGAICKALTEELDLPMTGRIKFDKDTSLDLISEMDALNQGINKVLEESRQKIIDQEKAVEEAKRAVEEAEKKLRAQQKALESAKKREAKTIETDPEKRATLERRFDEVWDRLGEIESEYKKEHKGERLGLLLSLEGVTVKETSEIKEYKKLEEEFKRINSQLGYGHEVHDEQIHLNKKTYDLDKAKRALISAQGTLDFYHDQLNWLIAPNGNEFAIEHIERLGLNSADTSAKSLTQDSALNATNTENQHSDENSAPEPESEVFSDAATLKSESEVATATLTDVEKHNDAPATEQPTPATPLDPTPETPVTEESASATEESASAAEESASATEESASAAEESASAAEESASAAENQGQGQDDAETASATAEQLKVNDNAQSEEKSDSDDLKSASATPPTDDQDQNDAKKPTGDTETAPADESASPTQKQPEVNTEAQNKEKSDSGVTEQHTPDKKSNTMLRQGCGTVNTTGSEAAAAAAAEAEAARQAAASTETKAAAQSGKKNDHGHGHK